MPTSQKKPVDCSELAASLAELAFAHGEAGISTLDGVVEAIRKDLPEVDRVAVADAIVAYSSRPKPEASLRDEATERLKTLKASARKDKRVRDQIKDLEEQLRTGNFKPPQSRAKRVLDEREERLLFERNKIKKQINREIEAAKPKTLFQKFVQSPFNEFRALMTGLEFSAVLRQGGFVALANPQRAAKALIPMVKSFGSERVSNRIDAEIRARPNAMLYEKAGLFLPEPDAVMSPRKSEEAFDTDLPIFSKLSKAIEKVSEKLPKAVGDKVKYVDPKVLLEGSARSYITFLNLLRADQFDVMAATLAKNGEPSLQEAKAIANFINVATGRGGLGKLERAASTLNVAFFAPRYVMSRFQLLLEPLRTAAAPARNKIASKIGAKETSSSAFGGTRETDKLIAKEYAKYAIAISSLLVLADLIPGFEIEKDPRSSDFLKVKVGNTRLDMLSGLQQAAVFMARQGSGQTKSTTTGEIEDLSGPAARTNRWDVLTKFMRSKLSPMIGTGVDLAVGKNVVGEPVSASGLPLQLMTPITYRDIYEVLTSEYGVPDKTALSMAALLGAGVQSFDPSAPRAPEEVVKTPEGEKEFYPGIGNTLRLNEDEYGKLLQAHEAGLAAIAEDEKAGVFKDMDQKEMHEEKRRVYDQVFKPEKEAIIFDALDRLYPQ